MTTGPINCSDSVFGSSWGPCNDVDGSVHRALNVLESLATAPDLSGDVGIRHLARPCSRHRAGPGRERPHADPARDSSALSDLLQIGKSVEFLCANSGVGASLY